MHPWLQCFDSAFVKGFTGLGSVRLQCSSLHSRMACTLQLWAPTHVCTRRRAGLVPTLTSCVQVIAEDGMALGVLDDSHTLSIEVCHPACRSSLTRHFALQTSPCRFATTVVQTWLPIVLEHVQRVGLHSLL